jgi:hypothetical protein
LLVNSCGVTAAALLKLKMKLALYNNHDSKIGLLSGLVGGVGKYFLQINEPFAINLLQASITALICGVAGVAGKEIYIAIKKQLKSKK